MKRASRILLLLSLFCGSTLSLVAQNTEQLISNYLKEHATGLQQSDFAQFEIVSETSSLAKGAKHVYIRQLKNGIPVVNGVAQVTIKNNQVIQLTSNLVSLQDNSTELPVLNANQAVLKALVDLGITPTALTLKSENTVLKSYLFDRGTISVEDIPVRLFLQSNNGKLQFVWELSIYPVGTSNWWTMDISATDGTVLSKNNLFLSCQFDHCDAEKENHAMVPFAPAPPPPPGMDQYAVYPLPFESPNHGPLTTITNPSDNTFSPYGWHDTNGSMGDEFTITRGNNVYAYEDKDDDNQPGYSPDGGASLDFSFPYDSIGGVEGNLDGVITNLFYMNNMMHDIWAYYGFDEVSGNFQERNYSNTGQGSDYVYAEAQDGSGTDNANFATPPDGSNPRMQMYLWNFSGYLAQLTVNDPDSIAGAYASGTANFGPSLTPNSNITADLVLVLDDGTDTLDACGTITNGPELNGKIALLRRGNCSNTNKVLACQNYGAIGVVVMQPTSNNPGSLLGSVPQGTPVTIPALIIGKADADSIMRSMEDGPVNVTLSGHGSPDTYDSDFDNGVIAHEFGHGISTRLVGGPSNSTCLFNNEQLGEGWSDWFALMVTMKAGDQGTDRRGIGTYVSGQPVTGLGIRPAVYSTNFAYNGYTFANSNTMTEAHDRGFIWTTMLWDLTWDLIAQYGYDPDIKNGTGGNNMAMALVIEGLKMTECGGGFEDARNGILAADNLLYDGANECLIWNAFAKRGLGASASQGDPDDAADQTAAFDLPNGCLNGLTENKINNLVVYPNPGTGEVTIELSNCKNATQMSVVDLTGNTILARELSGDNKLVTDLSSLSKGIYLIRIIDANGVHVIEWVKQ